LNVLVFSNLWELGKTGLKNVGSVDHKSSFSLSKRLGFQFLLEFDSLVEIILRKGLAEGVNSFVKLVDSIKGISVKLGKSLDFLVRFLHLFVSDALFDESFRSKFFSLCFNIDLGNSLSTNFRMLILLLFCLFPIILVIDVGDHSLLLLLGIVRLKDLPDLNLFLLLESKFCASKLIYWCRLNNCDGSIRSRVAG